MENMDNQNARLIKLLQASPTQQAAIDRVLEGDLPVQPETTKGPLFLGMGAAAKFLGVSRTTLWRMIRAGRLAKVEILPGSYRVCRVEAEALAAWRQRGS